MRLYYVQDLTPVLVASPVRDVLDAAEKTLGADHRVATKLRSLILRTHALRTAMETMQETLGCIRRQALQNARVQPHHGVEGLGEYSEVLVLEEMKPFGNRFRGVLAVGSVLDVAYAVIDNVFAVNNILERAGFPMEPPLASGRNKDYVAKALRFGAADRNQFRNVNDLIWFRDHVVHVFETMMFGVEEPDGRLEWVFANKLPHFQPETTGHRMTEGEILDAAHNLQILVREWALVARARLIQGQPPSTPTQS
ncbi:MAG: hypothetical protein HND42_02325 [Armatimonadetes bacterium]|nr:hypothetical protein [Armatimonadota bacterium]NOG92063.1 hypothetical protein [Armatimonadota bacterium]